MKIRLVIGICIICFAACKKADIIEDTWIPSYYDALDFSGIGSLNPQAVVELGKFVKVGDFLFVNDIKRGIHVIDNSVPTLPEYVYFWNIPGNQNFTIDGNFLYADNGPHLLVIDISNFAEIVFVRYIENTFFENLLEQFPEDAMRNEYFECPDPSQGLVKSWVKMERVNPNCRKI